METKRKRKIWILIVFLFLFAVGLVIILPTKNHQVAETISKIPGINKEVISETINSDQALDYEKEKERLQKEVDENTLNARIASSLDPDEEGFVYLSLLNKYDDKLLQVTVIDEVSGEIYYTSSVLKPNDEVDYGKLSYIPVSGEYDCIAYFYYYTLEEEPISMVGAKVRLNIKGE